VIDYDIEPASTPDLPFNHVAETGIISSILKKPELFDSLPAEMAAKDFTARNARVFSVISELVYAGKPVDIITVSEALSQTGDDELSYLADITQDAYVGANITAYAQIVADCAMQRDIYTAAMKMSRIAFDDEYNDCDERVQAVGDAVAALERSGGDEPTDINILLKNAVDAIDDRFRGVAPKAISTGFKDLDKMLLVDKTDLIILAARPSMGKTNLAINIASNIAKEKPVLFFSVESANNQITDRMIAAAGGLHLEKIKTGKLGEDDWPRLELGVRSLKDTSLKMHDASTLNISRLQAIARKENRRNQLGLVVVDYLQLLCAKAENKRLEIGVISRGLKALAKQLGCPVIALSQLSRSVEQRTNKRPINSDLRESGDIEQDADAILFIYRDEYYDEDSPDKGTAEIIVGKQRDGQRGTVRLATQLQYSRFADLAPDYQPRREAPPKYKSAGYGSRK